MKKLLITLILISPFSFADWGDVYYCQMTTFSVTTPEGKRTDQFLEKFKFKLDKAKQTMVFGGKGFFSGLEVKLNPNKSWVEVGSWYVNEYPFSYAYHKGQFLTGSVGLGIDVLALTADCEKF